MRKKLQVDHMPLSWCEEGEKGSGGYRVKSQCVGRRVWGVNPGQALYMIESDGPSLVLRDLRDGSRILQRWPTSEGYESPWGGEGQSRLAQVAEWHEGREFNAWHEALRSSQEWAWQEACKQMRKDCER